MTAHRSYRQWVPPPRWLGGKRLGGYRLALAGASAWEDDAPDTALASALALREEVAGVGAVVGAIVGAALAAASN